MKNQFLYLAVAMILGVPALSQAQTVVIDGKAQPISLSRVDASQLGNHPIQFNENYSLMPLQAYFSGESADVLLINLSLQTSDLNDFEYSETEKLEILNSLNLVHEAIQSGDQLLMHELFGEIENLNELNCDETSNTFVLILEKENKDSLEASRILGNCATL